MIVSTRRKSGKVKEVDYAENEVEDHTPTDGIAPTPYEHSGGSLDSNTKTRTNLDVEINATSANGFKLQEGSEDKGNYGLSSGKKRKPRTPDTPAVKGKHKSKARKLDTLFDQLPIEDFSRKLDTLFERLPLEVVYNIFTFLHPLDLLRLARTNRMLRSHLMTKASARIWKAARERIDHQTPTCPSDHTEPQWARLLFTGECSNCDKNDIPNVNWVHRLRLCDDCSRTGKVLILREKVEMAFPAIEDVPSLLNILPFSSTGAPWNGEYYRIKDIQTIGAEWATIRKRGNKKEIDEFTMRRIKEVQKIVKTSLTFAAWERNRPDRMKKLRRKEIWARLEALGHHPSDVRSRAVMSGDAFRSSVNRKACRFSAHLTESHWNMIRPELEIAANQAKTKRLGREYRRVVQSRSGLAESLVKEYYTDFNVRPAFRPSSYVRDTISSKIFQGVIHQPTEVAVARDDFQEALDTVPELASNASREIQLFLLRLMVKGGARGVGTSPTGSSFDVLLLATATFFCNRNSKGLPHCGPGELDEHSCLPIPKKKPKFCCLSYDHRAGSAVAALLAVAGLDPNTTAEQMDEKDLRFYCLGCWNGSSCLAMSWRDAARHAKKVDHNEDSGWELFSPEETEAIKKVEDANIANVQFCFRCNTCYVPTVHRRQEREDHSCN